MRAGFNWTLVQGKDTGETYEEVKDQTDDTAQWDHPFDLYYMAKSVRGWPKFLIEVWSADDEGRYSIAGYGVGTIPI